MLYCNPHTGKKKQNSCFLFSLYIRITLIQDLVYHLRLPKLAVVSGVKLTTFISAPVTINQFVTSIDERKYKHEVCKHKYMILWKMEASPRLRQTHKHCYKQTIEQGNKI